jgi:uncharacterized cupredoxin-like copper-binding protein
LTVHRIGLAAALSIGLVLAACSSDDPSDQPAEGGVAVTLRDDGITLDPESVPAGEVAFTATNDGTMVHEFEVFTVPEGVDANALPVEDNVADAEGQGLEVVDEVEDIAPGTHAELSLDLDAGTYAVICYLSGHYANGMHGTLVVG